METPNFYMNQLSDGLNPLSETNYDTSLQLYNVNQDEEISFEELFKGISEDFPFPFLEESDLPPSISTQETLEPVTPDLRGQVDEARHIEALYLIHANCTTPGNQVVNSPILQTLTLERSELAKNITTALHVVPYTSLVDSSETILANSPSPVKTTTPIATSKKTRKAKAETNSQNSSSPPSSTTNKKRKSVAKQEKGSLSKRKKLMPANTSLPKMSMERAPNPLQGRCFNQISFVVEFDYETLKATPKVLNHYTGHVEQHYLRKLAVFIETSTGYISTIIPKTKFIGHVVWALPGYIDDNGVPVHGVFKTPDVYTISVHPDYMSSTGDAPKIHYHQRVFWTAMDPLPEKVIMRVYNVNLGTEEMCHVLREAPFSAYVKTTRDQSIEFLNDKNDLSPYNRIVTFCVIDYGKVQYIHDYLERLGYRVEDNMWKKTTLSLSDRSHEEMGVDAKAIIMAGRAKGLNDEEIAKIPYPMRTHVVKQLYAMGSAVWTLERIKKAAPFLFEMASALTSEQVEQLFDAYYWTHLVEPPITTPFQNVINHYAFYGRQILVEHSQVQTFAPINVEKKIVSAPKQMVVDVNGEIVSDFTSPIEPPQNTPQDALVPNFGWQSSPILGDRWLKTLDLDKNKETQLDKIANDIEFELASKMKHEIPQTMETNNPFMFQSDEFDITLAIGSIGPIY